MNENLAVTSESISFTELFVTGSGINVVTDSVAMAGGANLARGTVLGKVTVGAATAAAKSGGNTGNGTLTMNASTPVLAGAKPGVYGVRVICAAVAQVGTTPPVPAVKAFAKLTDPDGIVLDTFELPTTPGVTISNKLKFVILDGTTPFAAGDGFDITVAAGSGSYKAVNSANADGSQIPLAILAGDAASADTVAPVYLTGEFNAAALTFGGSDTADTHKDALRKLGIFAKTVA